MNEDKLVALVSETNDLLRELIHSIESSKSRRSPKRTSTLSAEDREELELEIDLEAWFRLYGEEARTASSMNMGGAGIAFTKEEKDYIYGRLQDHTGHEVNGGTHVWKFLGKVWCKSEKQARNCFACVPVGK